MNRLTSVITILFLVYLGRGTAYPAEEQFRIGWYTEFSWEYSGNYGAFSVLDDDLKKAAARRDRERDRGHLEDFARRGGNLVLPYSTEFLFDRKLSDDTLVYEENLHNYLGHAKSLGISVILDLEDNRYREKGDLKDNNPATTRETARQSGIDRIRQILDSTPPNGRPGPAVKDHPAVQAFYIADEPELDWRDADHKLDNPPRWHEMARMDITCPQQQPCPNTTRSSPEELSWIYDDDVSNGFSVRDLDALTALLHFGACFRDNPLTGCAELYADTYDTLMVDWYPSDNKNTVDVGEFNQRVRTTYDRAEEASRFAVENEKSLVFVALGSGQGHLQRGRAGYRSLSYPEYRYHTFAPVALGITQLLYWQKQWATTLDEQLVYEMISEVQSIGAEMVSGETNDLCISVAGTVVELFEDATTRSLNPDEDIVYRYGVNGNRHVLLAVNIVEHSDNILRKNEHGEMRPIPSNTEPPSQVGSKRFEVDFTLPQGIAPCRINVLNEDRTIDRFEWFGTDRLSFADDFDKFGVHIYEFTSPVACDRVSDLRELRLPLWITGCRDPSLGCLVPSPQLELHLPPISPFPQPFGELHLRREFFPTELNIDEDLLFRGLMDRVIDMDAGELVVTIDTSLDSLVEGDLPDQWGDAEKLRALFRFALESSASPLGQFTVDDGVLIGASLDVVGTDGGMIGDQIRIQSINVSVPEPSGEFLFLYATLLAFQCFRRSLYHLPNQVPATP